MAFIHIHIFCHRCFLLCFVLLLLVTYFITPLRICKYIFPLIWLSWPVPQTGWGAYDLICLYPFPNLTVILCNYSHRFFLIGEFYTQIMAPELRCLMTKIKWHQYFIISSKQHFPKLLLEAIASRLLVNGSKWKMNEYLRNKENSEDIFLFSIYLFLSTWCAECLCVWFL